MSKEMGQSYEGLAPEQRLIHYRLLAEDALDNSRLAVDAELRAAFLTIAQGFQTLAAEVERQMRQASPASAIDDDATIEIAPRS